VLSVGNVITTRSVSVLGAATPQPGGLPSLASPEHRMGRTRDDSTRIESAGGVKKDAAELMGISQRALSYYLSKYRID
jgi:hypothetical protein